MENQKSSEPVNVMREVVHEVFDDVTLGAVMLFMFLMQLLHTMNNPCTC